MRRLASSHSALVAAAQRAAAWAQTMLFMRNPAQGLVEYGLILVLIMVVCVGILTMVGKSISAVWYTKLINGVPW
ncbi:MAG: Flp family type IVb pilin [Roseiflexaceae bacterium]